jgi:hypothetical protein
MSGGGGSTNTVQKADPWSGAQPYLTDTYARAQTAANNTSTTPYAGAFVQPGNDLQQQGINQTVGLANKFQGAGDNAITLGKDTTNGAYLNGNNYLRPAIQANVDPIIRQSTEQMLPAIGSEAQKAGAYGGSRQALLEAAAMRDTNKQVADTAAQMLNTNFQNERRLQMAGPDITKTGMQLDSAPADLYGQAGAQQYNFDNLATQNALLSYQDTLNAPWRAVMPYTNILSGVGMPGGQMNTQQQSGTTAGNVIGGAAGLGTIAYMGAKATGYL